MSDEEDNNLHWSMSIWSTHVGGVHVTTLIPAVGVLFAGTPLWVLLTWILVSVVTHFSGFGLVGYFKRLRIRLGRWVHGESRIRKNKHEQMKRKRGTL